MDRPLYPIQSAREGPYGEPGLVQELPLYQGDLRNGTFDSGGGAVVGMPQDVIPRPEPEPVPVLQQPPRGVLIARYNTESNTMEITDKWVPSLSPFLKLGEQEWLLIQLNYMPFSFPTKGSVLYKECEKIKKHLLNSNNGRSIVKSKSTRPLQAIGYGLEIHTMCTCCNYFWCIHKWKLIFGGMIVLGIILLVLGMFFIFSMVESNLGPALTAVGIVSLVSSFATKQCHRNERKYHFPPRNIPKQTDSQTGGYSNQEQLTTYCQDWSRWAQMERKIPVSIVSYTTANGMLGIYFIPVELNVMINLSCPEIPLVESGRIQPIPQQERYQPILGAEDLYGGTPIKGEELDFGGTDERHKGDRRESIAASSIYSLGYIQPEAAGYDPARTSLNQTYGQDIYM